jgi:hypothetical protein
VCGGTGPEERVAEQEGAEAERILPRWASV